MDQMDDKTEKLISKIKTANHALTVYKSNVLLRTLGTLTAIVCVILLSFFGALSIVRANGSFTIDIPDEGQDISLSLSKTADFMYPTSYLSFDTSQQINNVSYLDLPKNLDTESDGEHCGQDYLAFTFYLKNVGEIDAHITATMIRTDVVKGSDKAIRVMVYKNGESTTYGMLGSDGTPEFDNPVSFLDDETIFNDEYILKTDEIIKYTIVIWLEGDDLDCIDEIMGGFVKLKMDFTGDK